MGKKIERFTAIVIIDNGVEGIPTVQMGDLAYPLVTGSDDNIKNIYDLAMDICSASGKTFKVIQSTGVVDVTDELRKKFSN